MSSTERMAPAEAFAQLGGIKLSETDLDGVLGTIARLARRTIPGADDVSVTLVRHGTAHTAAFSGELALPLDESQYETGHGPCLDAAAVGAVLVVPEIAGENRWPQWSARALAHGAHSSLSIGLPIEEAVSGALNLYATTPHAFDDEAVLLAEKFAGFAAVALANAHLYDTTATLADQMRAAMRSRAVIEQAKGIIMGSRRCSADEAFDILVRISQITNRKLRDVAAALAAQATPDGEQQG